MRWKIFIYMSGFVGVVLALLFLFQVIFLDDFYHAVKTTQIKITTKEIIERIEDNGINSALDYIEVLTDNSDYCIRLFDVENLEIYGNDRNNNICGFIGNSSNQIITQVSTLYKKAIEQNGEVFYEANTADRFIIDENLFIPDTKRNLLHNQINTFDYLVYGKITEVENQKYFILVNSRISIVSEIAVTIREQLLVILCIILVLALIFAFYMANKISSPIIKTNESAKKLAKGSFDTEFNNGGYKEIEELNTTLSYASKELRKAENIRNELIANISHDLRTPLTMIGGYAEIMRDLPGENTAENVQVIIDECKRLNILVNDILDLSKLQAKAQTLSIKSFNITQVIKGIIERFNTLLKNEDYKIDFEYDKETIVSADEVKINQVIYNLLANAIHYSGDNKKITVRQIDLQENVRIEVSDNGIGIKEEDLPYVWERYYKIDKVHKRPQVGTGLGLSIVKNVLDLHKVSYGVTSKEKEGTTFYFELKK